MASIEEARLAVRAGAAAVGLVSAMPSGPGPIPDEQIAAIARTVPPPIATFLLTCRQDAAGVIEQLRFTGCNTVQLCDELARGSHQDIRRALPNVKIAQVIHVCDGSAIEESRRLAPHVDAILLDSGRPRAALKELGGTGRRHDWAISRRIREAIEVPVFLAGGLKPDNVVEAITTVAPFALDVCSGVRTDGKLDAQKLRAFFHALNSVHDVTIPATLAPEVAQ